MSSSAAKPFNDDHVRQWQEQGWVLVPSLVPADEIDDALDDLWRLFPRPDEFHAGEGGDRRQGFENRTDPRNLVHRDPVPDDIPAFRDRQFLGRALFPFPGSNKLNRLAVHPNMVDFARTAMGDDDLRIYQMALWAKYTGVTNYAQPLHQDHNHSVVPARMEPGWWHMEGFLYLSDVDEDVAPTHAVSLSDSGGRITYGRYLGPDDDPALWAAAKPAVGPRGSFLAYRPDVWHRGVNLTRPGGSRFLFGLSFKHGGQDWIGYENVQSRSTADRFVRFVASCTPDELSLFGVPMPGHPFWNAATVDAMAERYPDLDVSPWRDALLS